MHTLEDIKAEIKSKYGDNAKYIMANHLVSDELEYIRRHQSKDDWNDAKNKHSYEMAMRKAEQANSNFLTPVTAKVGDGATVHFGSDAYACTIIKVTKCTVTVRQDKATLDPSFKPVWISGGFAGHCINQNEQTYTYESNPNGEIYRFYWSDKYNSFGRPGGLRLTKGRHEFYDYNF